MRPFGPVAAAGMCLLTVLAACSTSPHPAPSGSGGNGVYLGGQLARIPLGGSSGAPLHWQQVSFTGEQGDVSLALRRSESVAAIVMSSQRPRGVRLDPLLQQVWTGEFATNILPSAGDADTGHYDVTPVDKPVFDYAVGMSVTGNSALVSMCSVNGATTDSFGPFPIQLTRTPTDGGSSWRVSDTPAQAKVVSFDCAAWAKTTTGR